jgi:hypothetical protein
MLDYFESVAAPWAAEELEQADESAALTSVAC